MGVSGDFDLQRKSPSCGSAAGNVDVKDVFESESAMEVSPRLSVLAGKADVCDVFDKDDSSCEERTGVESN